MEKTYFLVSMCTREGTQEDIQESGAWHASIYALLSTDLHDEPDCANRSHHRLWQLVRLRRYNDKLMLSLSTTCHISSSDPEKFTAYSGCIICRRSLHCTAIGSLNFDLPMLPQEFDYRDIAL